MKLGMKEHVDVVSGVQDEFDVGIEANAVAFYAQISGLAKDKIGYPIRELSTNAWDASRGNFEVHLPTGLNPVFRVRDFGPGMSADDMKNVYARLYASTKRKDNEQVGGWGLGSKSPFAYLIGADGAGSYNVTSYHGGMMRSYVLSLAADGKPKMRMLAEMASSEPTGLEVSFAVRREDIATFHDRARHILWSFNPRPRIRPEIDWPEPQIKTSGENWTSFKSSSVPFYGPQVRMGCVMYPFDLRQIKSTGFLVDSDTVLFDAPIGSLKVVLSREELAYDETTKNTLQGLVAAYEENFISQLSTKVEAAASLFEAVVVFETETEGLGESRQDAMRRVVKWRGHRLDRVLPKLQSKMCMLGDGWQEFDKFSDQSVRAAWAVDAVVVIEHNPLYSFSRFGMAELVGKKVLWVRCKRADRDMVLSQLGNPEVIDLDTFKVPVEKRTSKTIRKRRTLVVTRSGFHTLTQDVDLADGGHYVEISSSSRSRRYRHSTYYRFSDDHGNVSAYDLEQTISSCRELGVLEVGQIILVKAHDQEIPDNWTLIGEEIIPALEAKVDLTQLTDIHKRGMSDLGDDLTRMLSAPQFAKAPVEFFTFSQNLAALANRLRGNRSETTVTDKAIAALSKIGVNVEKPRFACPISVVQNEWRALTMRFPLLAPILRTSSYYRLDHSSMAQLRHYFEVLVDSGFAQAGSPQTSEQAAPPPAPANDDDFDVDIEDDDDDVELLDEAA